jgi:hypothetical protein
MRESEVCMRFARAVLVSVVAIAVAAPAALAQQNRDGTVARLVDMHGNVLVSRDSGLASGNEELRVMPGTRVITTANSEVVVEYDDGCRVQLKENQRFEVERGKPCALLLAQNILQAPAAAFSPVANILIPAGIGAAAIGMLIDSRGRQTASPS